ncbi:hypothetical protein CcCBS67573_g07601 [Chytriomyces confervae]|uniref:Mitochondrial carrier protein n=1 Tax=Chytriomyces confervae TaxID=246404 RepID=A0A507EUW1_9FUNG|nr:hypothetical protein HDU80_006750 [Chytriomyces hyalinus]TPX67147.1 hypothetical protein CcCBS67573_g07601 [Chytriomyces confervae]
MRHESGASKAGKGVLGAATAGFMELFLFHPLDTAAKRLINHRGWEAEKGGLAKIIFKDASNGTVLNKVSSLYKAFGYAVGYKMLQRSLQFGSHPIISDYLKTNYLPSFKENFGERMAKTMISGVSGIIIGTFEVILLPLDALKVKRQTGVQFMSNPAYRNPSFVSSTAKSPLPILQQNATLSTSASVRPSPPLLLFNLYRGATWTAARNSIGLFALFGTSTFVKEDFYGLGGPQSPPATVFQLFTASLCGAVMSIAVAAPFDVIKVRMQATSIDSVGRISGIEIFKSLMKTEGLWALTKGCAPKMVASGPKVAFSFTVAQWLTEYFSRQQ